MKRSMPYFEWAQGIQIGEDLDLMEEQRLTITNINLETEGQDESNIMKPQLEQI